MNTLKRFGGTWYANGKPYTDLQSAVKALEGDAAGGAIPRLPLKSIRNALEAQ